MVKAAKTLWWHGGGINFEYFTQYFATTYLYSYSEFACHIQYTRGYWRHLKGAEKRGLGGSKFVIILRAAWAVHRVYTTQYTYCTWAIICQNRSHIMAPENNQYAYFLDVIFNNAMNDGNSRICMWYRKRKVWVSQKKNVGIEPKIVS